MARAYPAGVEPIVALFCTRGMEDFLSNAVHGIMQVGVNPGQIHVGCPNNALSSVRRTAEYHSSEIHVISNQELSRNDAALDGYAEYGTRVFIDISWKKIIFIKQLVEHHPHVIYSDIDVSWIRNPVPYLVEVGSTYPMAFQTESVPQFPPALCCGFASFRQSKTSISFLDALLEFDSAQVINDGRVSDQTACQRLIENKVSWLRDIYCLPESLFLNGLGYRNLQNGGRSPVPLTAEIAPFIFHANWTIGADNKRSLLARSGTWFVGPYVSQPPLPSTLLKRVLISLWRSRG